MEKHDLTTQSQPFSGVYWLGGAPCAGKSTIATLLGDRFDINIVHPDDDLPRQMERLDPQDQPFLTEWEQSSWDERWLHSPEVLLEKAIGMYCEHLAWVLADLQSRESNRPMLIEDNCLLPDSITPFIKTTRNVLYLIPTAQFQRFHYERRPWIKDILQACSDPERALDNWMAREVLFAQWVRATATENGLRVVKVDGSRSIEETAALVAHWLGL